MALGCLGFAEAYPERSHSSVLHLTVQLFALNSGTIEGSVPWTLDVARFLAPLATAGALLTALAAVFRNEVSTQRARFARNHTIVAGMSEAADLLARDVRGAGGSVVVVALDDRDPRVSALQRDGFPVLVADPAQPADLLRAGLGRADHLVALADTTTANAAIAAGVLEAQRLTGDRNKRFRSFIAVDDPALLVALQSSGETRQLHLRQEFFSPVQRAAVAVLDTLDQTGSSLARLLVFGSGDAAAAVVAEALRRADEARILSLTVHADQARCAVDFRRVLARDTPALRTRVGLARLDRVTVVDVDEQLDRAQVEALLAQGGMPDAAILALADPSQLLRWSMMLREVCSPSRTPVVTITTTTEGLTSLLGSDRPDAVVSVVSILLEGCVDERIVSGRLERMARAIHEDYLGYIHAHEQAEERSQRPAARPWNDLTPELRQSNFDAAQAVWSALEVTGHRVVPLHSRDAAELEFDPMSLRRLVELEHARWLGDGGSVPSEPVPWDQISKADRNKTEAQVRNLPRILADAGLEIVRRPPDDSGT